METIDLDDLVEEQFYSKNNKVVSRRDFLKYSAVGSLGLLLPIFIVEEANAILPLIAVAVGVLTLTNDLLASEEPTEGTIVLINNSPVTVEGDLKLTLLDEWDLGNKGSTRSTGYRVPKNKGQRYGFSDGPSLKTDKDTLATFRANSRADQQEIKNLSIKA